MGLQVNFYTKWHKGRGDQQVIMQKWGKHPHHGRVRDLQFQVKIKGVSAALQDLVVSVA